MASDTPLPSKTVKKYRQYDLSYLELGFIRSSNDNTKPMCLICGSLFSNEAMKPSRLKDHLTRLHSSKLNADFKKIEVDWEKERHIKALFAKRDIRLENGLTASYNISLMVARTGTRILLVKIYIAVCQGSNRDGHVSKFYSGFEYNTTQ